MPERYNKTLIKKARVHPGWQFFSRSLKPGESTQCYVGIDDDGDGLAESVAIYRVTCSRDRDGFKRFYYELIEKITIKEINYEDPK